MLSARPPLPLESPERWVRVRASYIAGTGHIVNEESLRERGLEVSDTSEEGFLESVGRSVNPSLNALCVVFVDRIDVRIDRAVAVYQLPRGRSSQLPQFKAAALRRHGLSPTSAVFFSSAVENPSLSNMRPRRFCASA